MAQEELAEKVGEERSYISKVETNFGNNYESVGIYGIFKPLSSLKV